MEECWPEAHLSVHLDLDIAFVQVEHLIARLPLGAPPAGHPPWQYHAIGKCPADSPFIQSIASSMSSSKRVAKQQSLLRRPHTQLRTLDLVSVCDLDGLPKIERLHRLRRIAALVQVCRLPKCYRKR